MFHNININWSLSASDLEELAKLLDEEAAGWIEAAIEATKDHADAAYYWRRAEAYQADAEEVRNLLRQKAA